MTVSDLKIGWRLGAAFAIVLSLFGITSAISVWQLSMLNSSLDDLAHRRMVLVGYARDIKDNTNVIARAVRNAVLTQETAVIEAEVKRISESSRR